MSLSFVQNTVLSPLNDLATFVKNHLTWTWGLISGPSLFFNCYICLFLCLCDTVLFMVTFVVSFLKSGRLYCPSLFFFFQEYFGCSNLLHFHCILGSACQFLQIRQLGFWKGSCWFLSSIWGLLTSKCYFWSSNIGCVLIHKHRMSLHLFSTLISGRNVL